jgi:NADH pyrophosphatase NudC (nudix superfamily)
MELLNVYDNEGNATDRVVPRGDKSVILNDNEHIGVVVVFIENSKGEFLIQKTSVKKGSEYSSTGGHVDAGETHLSSILRESKEELGMEVDESELEYLGFLLYDKPIRFMYYLKKDIDIKDIVVQEDEVEFVKYMNIDEIKEIINKGEMTKSHGIIFNKILELKNK